MPYRKLDRTELLEEAGLDEDDDVTTWEEAFPGVLLLGEGFRLLSVVALGSRDKSSAGLNKQKEKMDWGGGGQKRETQGNKTTTSDFNFTPAGRFYCHFFFQIVVISVSAGRLQTEG